MKIGILTSPLKSNYGGILQNWALQQVLIKLGHKPITIDVYPHPGIKIFILSLFPVLTQFEIIHCKNRSD